MIGKLLLAVSVGLLAYWLYTPLPEGYEQPWRTRVAMGCIKVAGVLTTILDKLFTFETPVGAANLASKMIDELLTLNSRCEDVKYTDEIFDGVRVRIYRPSGRSPSSQSVVFYHGGGWVSGDGDVSYHCYLHEIAKRTSVILVAVSYRLAPTHVFPAPIDDCVRATKYFIDNAAQYDVDPTRVAIAGDSAGGHLAAVASQILRDEGFHTQPAAQILIQPATQAFDFLLPSYQSHADVPSLTKRSMISYWLLFFKGKVTDEDVDNLSRDRHKPADVKTSAKYTTRCDVYLIPDEYYIGRKLVNKPVIGKGIEEFQQLFTDPRLSPLLADNVSNLPKALILTAEMDVLRDEGLMYATSLQAARNVVVHKHYLSAFHGCYLAFSTGMHAAEQALEDVVNFIRDEV